MKLVKWNNFNPIWPSILDDDVLSMTSDWSDNSVGKGLNIYETDDSVVVEAAVPGIPEDKVEITVEGNILTISGKNEEKEEDKGKKRIYKSTMQTSFSYSTTLPRMVDPAKAHAEVTDGIVKVSIAKTEDEKPKKIEIKHSKS